MKLKDYNKPGTYLNKQHTVYDVYVPEEGGLAIEVYEFDNDIYTSTGQFYNFEDLDNVEVIPVDVQNRGYDTLTIMESTNIKNLNEEVVLELHSLAKINEVAKIEKEIELRNEDDGDVVKFAHFHFRGVHFKFMRNCPQSKEDIPDQEITMVTVKEN